MITALTVYKTMLSTLKPTLQQLISETPYHSYLYAYPHKTAYRTLEHPVDLNKAWQQEDKNKLFLYLHIPFCVMRCGFCNLFTLAQPRGDMAKRYVYQLIQQIKVTADFLGEHQFDAFACGGGTPTFLEATELDRLFSATHQHLNIDMSNISTGIETSPETATQDRLSVCKNFGIERVSMGLQSFYHAEVEALVRKQKWQDVDAAIERIRQLNFPILNFDLIYGIPVQTVQTFLDTVNAALHYAPEELYLYPLYVRPLTGLKKIENNAQRQGTEQAIQLVQQHQHAQDLRLEMYNAARDLLLAQGYEQVSMRMFQRPHITSKTTSDISYSCQNDGMIGLGCGARSYTRGLHYSEEYGVARAKISDILNDYCERDPQDFATARYGFALNLQEQQRRFIIQSLLLCTGLSLTAYEKRFGSHCMNDFPQLQELLQLELASLSNTALTLTPLGMGYADTIGPWLVSSQVEQLMQAYELT